MGRVKNWMIEQEMLEHSGARVEFICPNPECANWIEQYNEIPYPDYMAEKQTDISQTDDIQIICHNCNTVYEGSITNDSAFVTVKLHGYPDLDIEVDTPQNLDDTYAFEDYLPSDDPYSVAKEALGHLEAMIGLKSPQSDPQFTNRLLFAGAVSCFEAYLGDTLINAVKTHINVRSQLLKTNDVIGRIKFSASDLASDPEIVLNRIVSELRIVLYHNLKIVTKLYKDTFEMDLMPSSQERKILFPAMMLRHHCVHRNGRDKEGKKLNNFDENYVRSVISSIIDVVDYIEKELNLKLPF